MRRLLATLILVLFSLSACHAQQPTDPMEQVRESHVKGNVPAEERFQEYLERDVKAYLDCDAVEIELLRKAPTQVGVGLPKFYLWVIGSRNGEVVTRGAMRVAAVERQQFDVIQYFTARSILEDPESVKRTFPSALVEKIMKRARET